MTSTEAGQQETPPQSLTKGCLLILHAVVAGGVAWVLGAQHVIKQKPEFSQPVVVLDNNHILARGQPIAAVPPKLVP